VRGNVFAAAVERGSTTDARPSASEEFGSISTFSRTINLEKSRTEEGKDVHLAASDLE